jgi:hypothetical protein
MAHREGYSGNSGRISHATCVALTRTYGDARMFLNIPRQSLRDLLGAFRVPKEERPGWPPI